MRIFKILRIRRRNRLKREINKQSKRKQCCESCKYCYISGECFGYVYYDCRLDELDFDGSPQGICKFKCEDYEPCREYKKYLKNKKYYKQEKNENG